MASSKTFGSDDSTRPVAASEPTITSGRLTKPTALLHQAVGFVSAGLNVSSDDALVILEREAKQFGIDVADLAREIVERRRPLPAG